MNGTIVIDGTWESTLLDEPLELTIENGIVVDIKGDSTAAKFVNSLVKPHLNLGLRTVNWFGLLQNLVLE